MKPVFPQIRSQFLETDLLRSLADFAECENVELYLVGGTVRDIFLGKEVEDLDFVVIGNAFSFARKFANQSGASFVPLDEEKDTARVVFRRGALCIDFSGVRGADIETDLAARDLTINAMAIDLDRLVSTSSTGIPARANSHTGAHEVELIDPHGGARDLDSKLIRLVSSQSIEDDPLRMLRAYRFAATLGFTIDNATSSVIQDSLELLDRVSAERVRDELFKILAVDDSFHYLKAMDDVGLLERIFPEIILLKGMEQNEYHHLDVWGHSMLTLEFLESDPVPDSLESYLSQVEGYLRYEPVKGRARMCLLKLAALLHDVGKPDTRTIDRTGRIRFFDHNLEGAEIVAKIGNRLKLAKRETLFLRKVIEGHMYPLGLSVSLRRQRSVKEKRRAIRRFIHRTEDEWLAVLLVSYADLQATQGPWRKPDDLDTLAQLIGEIASTYFKEIHESMPRLITGTDLMEEFKLPPSPLIGELLEQVREAQMDGLIKTRDEAIEIVREFLPKR